MSTGARWLNHPIVRGVRARRIVTDGRRWTCLGPLMIPEIESLKALAQ
jgi:iron complex transport system substrate-binding protein